MAKTPKRALTFASWASAAVLSLALSSACSSSKPSVPPPYGGGDAGTAGGLAGSSEGAGGLAGTSGSAGGIAGASGSAGGIGGTSGTAGNTGTAGLGVPKGCGGQGGGRVVPVPDCSPLFRGGGTVVDTIASHGRLLTADMNGDGKPDLIAADMTQMHVYLNDGAGHFTGIGSYDITSRESFDIATGDLNGDGLADVAVIYGAPVGQKPNGPQLGVFLNKGDGRFSAEVRYDLPVDATAVGIGDLDGDQRGDVIVSGYDGTYALPNQGSGQLAAPVTVKGVGQNGNGGDHLEIADFDGNGKLDFAMHNWPSLGIWLNQGGWAFLRAPIDAPKMSFQPQYVSFVIADMNHDGSPDLVATLRMAMVDLGSWRAVVGINDGHGNFAITDPTPPIAASSMIATGDFNADGRRDFAVIGFGAPAGLSCGMSGSIVGLMAQADGSYAQTACSAPIVPVNAIAAADFDGDGKADIAFITATGIGLQIATGP
jgi:FG-GAP-like repeat